MGAASLGWIGLSALGVYGEHEYRKHLEREEKREENKIKANNRPVTQTYLDFLLFFSYRYH
jgi:hypothetical protein